MDFFTALKISSSAMSAERTRVNIASSNLANAETTRTADGTPYRRLDPVFQTMAVDAEAGVGGGAAPAGVQVAEIVADQGEGRRIYSPGHPDADAEGFVTFPNVNPIHEVVNLLSATRAFEANVVAVDTLKSMALRGLDIAR